MHVFNLNCRVPQLWDESENLLVEVEVRGFGLHYNFPKWLFLEEFLLFVGICRPFNGICLWLGELDVSELDLVNSFLMLSARFYLEDSLVGDPMAE